MVICDKCNSKVELKEKKLSKGITEVYFLCEACGERYTAYRSNNKISKLQRQIKGLRAERQEAIAKDIDNASQITLEYKNKIHTLSIEIEHEMNRIIN